VKAIIFGVSGQDGHYLRDVLNRHGVEVFGVARSGGDARLDVSDSVAVQHVVRQVRPDLVFNLAATSSTSHEDLWVNHAAISTGSLAILDAVERHASGAKVLLVGSGLQFINDGLPLHEQSPLGHSSPYVVARNQSLFAARYYRQRGLKTYFAFLFNHDSPMRSTRHLNMKIAEAAARVAVGLKGLLQIGDLDALKEFNYAGDVAQALWVLINQDDVFECVVGSGRTYKVREWIESCFKSKSLNWEEHVSINYEFHKPYNTLQSDPRLLFSLGWRPRVDFESLRKMMMEEAMKRTTINSVRQRDS
jgi:GDPmannose 4,6-dehydratase